MISQQNDGIDQESFLIYALFSQKDKLDRVRALPTIGIKGFKRENQLDSEEQEFSNSSSSPTVMDLFSACIVSSKCRTPLGYLILTGCIHS